jgi:hypothetical protein
MNAVVQKEAIKIKLDSHAQFLEAWDLLVKLGYNGPQENKPEIYSKHLYGRLVVILKLIILMVVMV